MSDPVSWFVVERTWKVFGSGGDQVGTVEDVVGDPESDIFSGVRVAFKLLEAARFIPAEHVARIVDGEVHLELTSDEARESRFHEPGESHQNR
jgi:uncharacterized protein YrrD